MSREPAREREKIPHSQMYTSSEIESVPFGERWLLLDAGLVTLARLAQAQAVLPVDLNALLQAITIGAMAQRELEEKQRVS